MCVNSTYSIQQSLNLTFFLLSQRTRDRHETIFPSPLPRQHVTSKIKTHLFKTRHLATFPSVQKLKISSTIVSLSKEFRRSRRTHERVRVRSTPNIFLSLNIFFLKDRFLQWNLGSIFDNYNITIRNAVNDKEISCNFKL